MAPSPALAFPGPSAEAPNGLQPTPATHWENGVPGSAVNGALISDRPCQTLHQAAKLHSPHLFRVKSMAVFGASAVASQEEELPREEGLREGQSQEGGGSVGGDGSSEAHCGKTLN